MQHESGEFEPVTVSGFERTAHEASDNNSIRTGFPGLDRATGGGLRRGDLSVLAGDVGSGKSALALAIALRAARHGHMVLFLSGEMSPERLLERAVAMEARVRIDDLRQDSLADGDREKVAEATNRLRERLGMFSRLPPGGVEALAKELQATLGAELVIVDTLQSLGTGRTRQDEELAAAARELKALALDLDVALLLAAHVPELARDRADPRPRLSDLGSLGSVAQHSDLVLGLFREEMYAPSRGIEGATELHILKNRNGASGYVDLYFHKQWVRFEDVLDED